MNRIILYILSVIVSCMMAGCGGRKTNKMLAYTDSLISRNQDDYAMTVLNGITTKNLKDDGDIAYYNLLMTQVRYRLYLPPLPDTMMINKSIKYFQGKDNEMLARSYYFTKA